LNNESDLVDYIQHAIFQEEKNYQHALSTNKSIDELKWIQDRLDYLKETYRQIEGRYKDLQQSDFLNF